MAARLTDDSDVFYSLLRIVRVLADSRAGEILGSVWNEASPSSSVLETARELSERYLVETSSHDWAAPGEERLRILDELRAVASKREFDAAVVLAAKLEDPQLEHAAFAWREMLRTPFFSSLSLSKPSRDALSRAQADDGPEGTTKPGDEWDQRFTTIAESWDPETVGYGLFVIVRAEESWEVIRSLASATDQESLIGSLRTASPQLGIPPDVVDRIEANIRT